MKLRTALIASGVWTAVGVLGCVVLISVIASQRGPRRAAEQRAQQAGAGAGVAMAIGYGAIWLPYAAAVGRRRREEAQVSKGRLKRGRSEE